MSEVEPFVTSAPNTDADLLVVPGWLADDWLALFARSERLEVARGEVLIEKDSIERAIYFVVAGGFEVTSASGAGAIARIHPGSVVGEIAFLDGQPRSAFVSAVVDSVVQRLGIAEFDRLKAEKPRHACDLALALGRIVALRLRHTFAQKRS